MGRFLMSLALSLALLTGAPAGAWAQSPEAQTLGLQMSQKLFKLLPLDDIFAKSAASNDAGFDLKSRPEWKGYLSEAMQEELRHDLPAVEKMIGRALARNMTVDELKVGIALLDDPGMRSAMTGEGDSKAIKPSRASERLIGSPAGVSFMSKMENIDKMLDPIFDEFLIELLPGALRRFADKVEAGEARRAAAP